LKLVLRPAIAVDSLVIEPSARPQACGSLGMRISGMAAAFSAKSTAVQDASEYGSSTAAADDAASNALQLTPPSPFAIDILYPAPAGPLVRSQLCISTRVLCETASFASRLSRRLE